MTGRIWPVHRAQAKCALIAADFLADEAHGAEAYVLCEAARDGSAMWEDGPKREVVSILTEAGFRGLLAKVLSWEAEEIEPTVAWVYGEATAAPTTIQPAEHVAEAWIAAETTSLLGIDYKAVRASLARLIECERAAAAAAVGQGSSLEASTLLRPAEEIAGEMAICDGKDLSIGDDIAWLEVHDRADAADRVTSILTRLIERSRAEGAAAERARAGRDASALVAAIRLFTVDARDGAVHAVAPVDAALLSALRAEEAHDANPHSPGSSDPLAARLYNHGVRAEELAQRGARHVAERLFELAERSHAETKQLRERVAELDADLARTSRDPAALVAAIRRFTVDARDGAAHGEAERQILRLQELLAPERWPAVSRRQLASVHGAAATLCEALADDTRALRLAAEAFFGGDFTAPDAVPAPPRGGIYIASKSKHGARWRELRAAGTPIISTWIDEAEEGQTADWSGLWDRCIREASTADVMVVYVEPDEVHKGSLVELGAALRAGVPVLWVGPEYSTAPRHRLVRRIETMDEAIAIAVASCGERQAAEAGGQPR